MLQGVEPVGEVELVLEVLVDGVHARVLPGRVRLVEEVQHGDFVSKAWVEDPLAVVLARISGYSRTPPPAPRRRR